MGGHESHLLKVGGSLSVFFILWGVLFSLAGTVLGLVYGVWAGHRRTWMRMRIS